MYKKAFVLAVFLWAVTTIARAQNSPPRGSSYQDSVRSSVNPAGKVNIVNGTPMNSAMDFVENLTQSKSHTLFLAALRAASMIGTLKSRGPLTIFAPTDSAFKQKLGRKLDTLMRPDHKYELINILSYHIVSGNYNAKDIAKLVKNGKGETSFLTLAGSKLVVRINENRNLILLDETGGQSIINQFNIEQSNGLMHLVTQVLVPKQKAL